MSYFKNDKNGIILYVYVQPGCKSEGVVGIHEEKVKIRIASPANDNQANEALIRFLAKKLKLSPSKISIIRGQKSRKKDLLLQAVGIDLQVLFL